MDSTTTASHNAERQGITGTPEQFVLGNRFPKTSTNTQQGQSSTNTGYKKTSSAKYNVELLKELANDFGYLLNRTDISDCWLNVNDTYMAVHQCVLAARSNTFSAIMSGNNSKLDPDIKKELQTLHKNDKLVIFIKKTDPEIMKQVIIFMYTAKCELNETNAFYLLDAAGRYDIKSLKVYTAQYTYMAVHRCVLAARSNTFSAVMSGNYSRLDLKTKNELETSTKNNKLVISITRTSPEIMKQVIIFMYTANCELNERNAFHLLDAAGRYDIKSLKVYTARFLVNHIDTNNVLRLTEAAFLYDNILLKQRCIDYFIDHAREVMDISELWKPFAEKYPAIVSELLYCTVHKDEHREQTA
ncbi:unnamed protein product [Rotaria sp. Silwood1]|nr:unnamed protein product [Rotaria sp. Silwood1]